MLMGSEVLLAVRNSGIGTGLLQKQLARERNILYSKRSTGIKSALVRLAHKSPTQSRIYDSKIAGGFCLLKLFFFLKKTAENVDPLYERLQHFGKLFFTLFI